MHTHIDTSTKSKSKPNTHETQSGDNSDWNEICCCVVRHKICMSEKHMHIKCVRAVSIYVYNATVDRPHYTRNGKQNTSTHNHTHTNKHINWKRKRYQYIQTEYVCVCMGASTNKSTKDRDRDRQIEKKTKKPTTTTTKNIYVQSTQHMSRTKTSNKAISFTHSL